MTYELISGTISGYTDTVAQAFRHWGRYFTFWAAAPRLPHRPLSRRSNRTSLLALGPLGVSVDHWDTPDTLASSIKFTHATARNVQFRVAARRVPKKVVAMRPAPKSWQWQQIKDVKERGNEDAQNTLNTWQPLCHLHGANYC